MLKTSTQHKKNNLTILQNENANTNIKEKTYIFFYFFFEWAEALPFH
jgi:hypothetical protein